MFRSNSSLSRFWKWEEMWSFLLKCLVRCTSAAIWCGLWFGKVSLSNSGRQCLALPGFYRCPQRKVRSTVWKPLYLDMWRFYCLNKIESNSLIFQFWENVEKLYLFKKNITNHCTLSWEREYMLCNLASPRI